MDMRRTDRQLHGLEQITGVLDRTEVVRLGLVDSEGPYVVPVHFAYVVRDGKITILTHGAAEGRKLAAIAADPRCCIEVDRLISHGGGEDGPCSLTADYESVIGFGNAHLITNPHEAREALAAIVARVSSEQASALPPVLPPRVAVIAIDLHTVTGKAHRS